MEQFIEKKGNYLGFDYLVKMYESGHRCGYVRVPHNVPAYKLDFSQYEIEKYNLVVHGGITFAQRIYHENKLDFMENKFEPGYWIGFDCAHIGDAKDFESAIKYFGKTDFIMRWKKIEDEFPQEEATIKDANFCFEMCKSLIRQLKGIK